MKRNRILFYIINLLFLSTTFGVHAQKTTGTGTVKTPVPVLTDSARYASKPFFRGMMIGVDIADPIMRIFGQDYGGYEVMAEANLLNRFFPEVSFGMGNGKTTADRDYTYDAKTAFYGRIGMHYNFRYKVDAPNFFVVSLRYGFSSYKADITNLYYTNGYWEQSGPYNLYNQKFNSHWLEIGAGIRVKVVKNLYMGWVVYYKPLLKEGSTQYANPWYIPGYGINGKGFGISYNIYYNLPFFK